MLIYQILHLILPSNPHQIDGLTNFDGLDGKIPQKIFEFLLNYENYDKNKKSINLHPTNIRNFEEFCRDTERKIIVRKYANGKANG